MWGTARSRERRFARHASKELLDLFHAAQREHPELSGRPLYQEVVARRLGPDHKRAAEIIRHAEESFTDWPVERALRFRHVVHYLIFDEYMRLGKARDGTRINMGSTVACIIPEEA
ncbi:MAG TPA: hypothetical protein VFK87_00280 [Steroidobacteraceae bacterium]|nr:hypothetical protein [Steroidobacteraceae bacterium]